MDIQITKIDKSNAQILNCVDEDAFYHAISMELLADYLNETNYIMYVALVDELVVGQLRAIIHKHPDQLPELYIDNLGVASTYKRKGIATQLMVAIMRSGKEHGCKEMWLGTEVENKEAIAFYQSFDMKLDPMVMLYGDL